MEKAQTPASKSGTSPGGRPPVNPKEVINAIFYVVKTGCPWRSLPHDFPKWSTVYGYFHRWGRDGTWELVNTWFVKETRRHSGRKKRPTAGCLDSRTVKTTGVGGPGRGWDGGKRMKGYKRFVLTDTQGLLPGVWVCAASVGEKAGAMRLLTYQGKGAPSHPVRPFALGLGGWGLPWCGLGRLGREALGLDMGASVEECGGEGLRIATEAVGG